MRISLAWPLWCKAFAAPVLVSIVYFALVYICWHFIGYQGLSFFFGILTFFVKCAAFPIWFSTLVNSVRDHFSNKAITFITFVLFGAYLIGCVYLNNWVFIHASGYYNEYYIGPNRSNETVGIGYLLTIALSAVATVVYIISFWINRKKNTKVSAGQSRRTL